MHQYLRQIAERGKNKIRLNSNSLILSDFKNRIFGKNNQKSKPAKVWMDKSSIDTTQKNVRREKRAGLSWRLLLQGCFLVLFIAVAVPFVIPVTKLIRALFAWEHTVNATLTLLQSANLLFLVTDKLTSRSWLKPLTTI